MGVALAAKKNVVTERMTFSVCDNGLCAIARKETQCKDTPKCSRTFAPRQKQNPRDLPALTLRAIEKVKVQGRSKSNRLISPKEEIFPYFHREE